MFGQEEELPPFTVYLPAWLGGRHGEVQRMMEEWGLNRFAYTHPLPGVEGGTMNEIHELVNGEWA